MLFRAPEDDVLPYCAEHNVAGICYLSLEQGLLTGKVGPDRIFNAGIGAQMQSSGYHGSGERTGRSY